MANILYYCKAVHLKWNDFQGVSSGLEYLYGIISLFVFQLFYLSITGFGLDVFFGSYELWKDTDIFTWLISPFAVYQIIAVLSLSVRRYNSNYY